MVLNNLWLTPMCKVPLKISYALCQMPSCGRIVYNTCTWWPG